MAIRITSLLLGGIGGFASIVLWIIFTFLNPYSNGTEMGPIVIIFLMLFLPACLALVATISSRRLLMLLSFIWSLPFSLYVVLTPGIFALFGATCMLYLISFLFMKSVKSKMLVVQ